MKKNKIIIFIVGVVLLSIVFNVNMFAATRIHIPTTQLQDSEIYGGYSNRYTKYNCYAFAIDRFEEFNLMESNVPPAKYEPGYFSSGVSQFHPGITNEENLACIVSQDLDALGMNVLYCGDSMPIVEGNKKLICMRVSNEDYHFMKYVKEEDIWLHKPEDSCILKYNKPVCDDNVWLNEYAHMYNYNEDEGTYDVEYYHGGEGTEYDSNILYILYETPEKITLDCKSKNVIVNDTLVGTREYVHEIEIKCFVFYTFTLVTDININYIISNENMESVTYKQVGDDIQNGYEFSYKFSPGKYFIFLYSETSTTEFDVQLNISSEHLEETPLCTGHNGIADGNLYFQGSLHQIKDNKYEGFFTYLNTVEGLYKFTIEYDKPTNSTSNTSTVDIEVKKNNQDIKITSFNENNATKIQYCVVAFLNENCKYNIELLCNEEQYANLNLNIEKYNENYLEIDTFNLLESNNDTIYTLDNETLSNNNVFKIELKQTTKFNLNLIFESTTTSDIYLWFAKYTPSNGNPIITEIMSELTNHNYTEELILEEGSYYMCYFNKEDTSNISSYLTWVISDSGEEKLISDPNSGYTCGSQITLLEKDIPLSERSYKSTQILKGFTRIAYLNQAILGSCYNQSYYWYTSDESIASVSIYGTIFAKRVGIVKIMAVNKADPSKVYVKEFTVYGNSNNEVKEILVEDVFDLDSGTYKLNLTAQNSPYPMIQYYNWTINVISQDNNDFFVDMDGWGVVSANSTGVISLTGNYIYNSNYQIKYILRIIE